MGLIYIYEYMLERLDAAVESIQQRTHVSTNAPRHSNEAADSSTNNDDSMGQSEFMIPRPFVWSALNLTSWSFDKEWYEIKGWSASHGMLDCWRWVSRAGGGWDRLQHSVLTRRIIVSCPSGRSGDTPHLCTCPLLQVSLSAHLLGWG